MELVNHTRFPAGLFRAAIDDDRLAAALVVRVTFEMRGGKLEPALAQPWIVSGPPWAGPQGQMDSDEVFYRGGVDLFLFGEARTPGDRPATELDVAIRTGSFAARFKVFGERVWERRDGRLRPSAPSPFTAMPLTAAYAFGGTCEWDELEVPYPDNPDGIGFYLEESQAEGQRLPHLEDPEHLVEAWDDRPEPVGTTPLPFSHPLRTRKAVDLDESAPFRLDPRLFNAAQPRLIVERLAAGDVVELDGLSPRGPIAFEIPELPLRVRLLFEPELIVRKLAIDQLGIELGTARFFLTYRYPFRYVLHPLQRRSCELVLVGDATPHASKAVVP